MRGWREFLHHTCGEAVQGWLDLSHYFVTWLKIAI